MLFLYQAVNILFQAQPYFFKLLFLFPAIFDIFKEFLVLLVFSGAYSALMAFVNLLLADRADIHGAYLPYRVFAMLHLDLKLPYFFDCRIVAGVRLASLFFLF